MPRTTTKAKKEELPFTLSTSPRHEMTYSNFVQIKHGVYDFQLTFCTVDPLTPHGADKPNIIIGQTILLNPLHAKQFLLTLARNIEKYEAVFGEITQDSLDNAQNKGLANIIPEELLG